MDVDAHLPERSEFRMQRIRYVGGPGAAGFVFDEAVNGIPLNIGHRGKPLLCFLCKRSVPRCDEQQDQACRRQGGFYFSVIQKDVP